MALQRGGLAQAFIATQHDDCAAMTRATCGRDSDFRKGTDPSHRAPCPWNAFFAGSTPMTLAAIVETFTSASRRGSAQASVAMPRCPVENEAGPGRRVRRIGTEGARAAIASRGAPDT